MKNQSGYVDSFRRLIQCPTVSDSGHEYFEAFHNVLKEEFPSVFAKCERIELGRDVLLLKWKGKASDRPVVLMAHQDVVPADGGDWKCDPFAATVEDGKIYGRGTIDCKNTLFCTMQAVEELIESGFTPAQDIYLSYSDCEEISGPGAEMARDWLKAHGVRPNVVIDEGGAIIKKADKFMAKDGAMVGILEKGYADVKIIARGKGGHSSQPPKHSPLARLADFMHYVEHHSVFKPKMSAPAKAMILGLADVLKPGLKGLAKAAGHMGAFTAHLAPKLNVHYGAPMFKSTIVFTMCDGATAPNVIPQEAWVNANVRVSPVDSVEKCVAKLEKIARKFDCEVELGNHRDASPMADLTGDGYTQFVAAIKKTYPDVEVVPYYMFGGTDCRTMQEIATTAIRCTPCKLSFEQMGGMHAANENIDITSLGETVLCFKNFLEAYK